MLVLRAMYNVVVVYLGTLLGPDCGWEGATGRWAGWLLGKRAKRGGGEGECTLYNQIASVASSATCQTVRLVRAVLVELTIHQSTARSNIQKLCEVT